MKSLFVVITTFIALNSIGQKQEKVLDYISQFKELAVAEMQRTGVPASITLAQGIHESGAGASKLAMASNNHFGIKCKSNWTGESVKHDDDARGECFRKYPSSEDSYKDHSDFLKNGQRYAFLFSLEPTDYEGWALGLKKAGYATNPKYPQVLIKLIEDYQLQEYTLIALGSKTTGVNEDIVETNDEKEDIQEKNELDIENVTISTNPSYPEGEFKINETKVVFVKKGTSFLSIAKKYEIDLSKLFDFNDMAPAIEIEKDQLVYIQRKRKTGNEEIHIVKANESLHDIAQFQALRIESLLELNWLKNNEMPAIGERLSLRTKSDRMPKLTLKENYSLRKDNK